MKGFVLLAVVAGCTGGGSGGPGEQLQEIENRGSACFRGMGGSLALEPNVPIEIAVDFEVCLSSSCTHDSMASCAVTVSGSTVTIETHASWIDTSASASACTADCGFLNATCETPPLAAGEYTFVLGGQSVAVTIPSAPTAACIRAQ